MSFYVQIKTIVFSSTF